MDPFLGEIRVFSFKFAPKGWAFCDGSSLQVKQNAALFSLLSNKFGGDGQTTFLLPDLRGRAPMAFNPAATAPDEAFSKSGGLEQVTLTATQVPSHTHQIYATTKPANQRNANGNILATTASIQIYATPPSNPTNPPSLVNLNADSLGTAGGGGGHPNMQPFLVLNFCIAMIGLYPPRN